MDYLQMAKQVLGMGQGQGQGQGRGPGMGMGQGQGNVPGLGYDQNGNFDPELYKQQVEAMNSQKRKESIFQGAQNSAKQLGMSGLQAPPVPQERAMPMQSLMTVSGQGQGQSANRGQAQPFKNRYLQGLMGR